MRSFQCRSILTIEQNMLLVSTPYDQGLVASIKSLPHSERKYDAGRKIWLVDPKHAPTVAQWIEGYLGDKVSIPPMPSVGITHVKQYLRVRYIGACKARSDGTSSAFGLLGDDWKIIFPEQTLRDFFDGSRATPGERESFFSLLGISRSATPDEVSNGFRRMAKQWHPDVYHEENAAEIFMKIKTAYDILSDSNKRARYEAGLALEAMTVKEPLPRSINETQYGYRCPLRSGKILIEGVNKLSMIEVSKIFSWDDIVDNQGRVLITSWPKGAKEPVEEWL